MSALLPLVAHLDLRAPIAYRNGRCIAVENFLADIARLVTLLPSGQHMLNVCADRYHFMVGLAAAMCSGKISLLPSTHTPESVRQMRDFAADVFCLADSPMAIDLPVLQYPADAIATPAAALSVPAFSAQQKVAYVFTSGSTGLPVAHAKTWGALVGSVRAAAQRLNMLDGRAYTVIGTVPPQHMYGFESTVLLAMQSGAAFWAGKPFYAADIAAALSAVPEPRVLVSTPFHLRAFIAAEIHCPALQTVLSATAPLTPELAHAVEIFCAAPLLEIYGCTESGQIATRRPTQQQEWLLLDRVRMLPALDAAQMAGATVEGDFIAGRIELGDIIDIIDSRRFLLRGRSADLINIAGKRTSLAFLNHQLLAIAGVSDGCFFLPDGDDENTVTRLTAFAVADKLSAADIVRALRERIDPLFLPRPLHLVAQLPRNAAGKLPRSELQTLWQQHLQQQPAVPSLVVVEKQPEPIR